MPTTKDTRPVWMQRVDPLMKRLRDVGARMTWEGYASLNTDKPRQQDIIIQHWYTSHSEKLENGYDRNWSSCYIVTIWADGSGWNVWRQVDDSPEIQPTLDAIT
jgi:hypothetical protein